MDEQKESEPMKKLLALLFLASVAYADNTTPRLGLDQPSCNSTNWCNSVNTNWAILDSTVNAGAVAGGGTILASPQFSMPYYSGTGMNTVILGVPPGTLGQVYTSSGTSGAPFWSTITSGGGGSGSSSLQVTRSGVQITSPTASINFNGNDFQASAAGTTAQIYLNPNTTDFIHLTATLQSGSTFYVSSGTIKTQLILPSLPNTVLGTDSNGVIISTTSGCSSGSCIQNTSVLQVGATFFVSSGTAKNFNASTVTVSNAIQMNGMGNLSFVNQPDGLTYQFIGSSMTTCTTGQTWVVGSSNTAVCVNSSGGSGIPSPPLYSVQYDSAGVFGGTPLETVDSSSVSFNGISSVTFSGFNTLIASSVYFNAVSSTFTFSSGTILGQLTVNNPSTSGAVFGVYASINGGSAAYPVFGIANSAGSANSAGNFWATGSASNNFAIDLRSTGATNNHAIDLESGDIYFPSTGLAGTSGQALISQGSNNVPTWQSVINLQSSLQSGATFYVSSATVSGPLMVQNLDINTPSLDGTANNSGRLQYNSANQSQLLLTNENLIGSSNQISFNDSANHNYANIQMGGQGSTGAFSIAHSTCTASGSSDCQPQTRWSANPAGNQSFTDYNNTTLLTLSSVGSIINSSVTVISPTSGSYEASFSTITSVFNLAISTNGFVSTFGPSPTISSCGTTPNGSVVGDDSAGVITVGGTAPTACTLTFAVVHTGCTMVCNVNDNSLTITADISSLTTSALTLGFGVGGLAGGSVWYHCQGYGSTCK